MAKSAKSFADRAALAKDRTFVDRVQMALVAVAVEVFKEAAGEDSASDNARGRLSVQAARFEYARAVVSNPAAMASVAAFTISDSLVSPSSLPNLPWDHPTMQAVMELSFALPTDPRRRALAGRGRRPVCAYTLIASAGPCKGLRSAQIPPPGQY